MAAQRYPAHFNYRNPNWAMDKALEYLPTQELLKARFISKDWNNRIILHHKFPQITINKDFEHKDKESSFQNLQHARNFILDNVRISRGRDTKLFWSTHWPLIEINVRSLTLHNITVGCLKLGELINQCLELEILVLDNIKFEWEAIEHVPDPVENGVAVPLQVPVPRPSKTFCTHTGVAVLEISPPTIKKLVLRKLKYGVLPNCCSALFSRRCIGCLEEFEFSQNTWTAAQRATMLPTPQQVNLQIFELLQENLATIKKLTITGNTSGDELMAELQRLELQRLSTSCIKIGQPQNLNELDDTSIQYLRYIQTQQGRHPIHDLDLSLHSTRNGNWIEQVLRTLPELKKLTLSMNTSNVVMNLNYFERLEFLKELVIKENGKLSVNQEYLLRLPVSLRALSFDHPTASLTGNDGQFLAHVIQSPNLGMLKKLVITNGKGVNDALVQLIIQTMTHLEELTINDCSTLTDFGLTGLNPILVNLIQSKSAYFVLKNADTMIPNRSGRNLNELTRLHYLNLKGCKKISDISLHQAVQSPHLTEVNLSCLVNVSDLGLHWLCEKNPHLARIVCKNNRKVTNYGLNSLILRFYNITNIHTTKECVRRNLGNLPYVQQPRFRNIVTVAKWNEKL